MSKIENQNLSKLDQLNLLQSLIENDLQNTLLGDLLADGFAGLKQQLYSDFSFSNFRNWEVELEHVKTEAIAIEARIQKRVEWLAQLETQSKNYRHKIKTAVDDLDHLAKRIKSEVIYGDQFLKSDRATI